MTYAEAEALGKRIINTWRLTPPLPEWIDVLVPLDHARAVATFTELRASVDGNLSIARFFGAHNARDRDAKSARSRRPPRADCEHCDGDGWEPGPPEYETIGGEPHEYTTVTECRCTRPAGAARSPVPEQLEAF